jgi:murein DD-endopeptidase MepM/ murein hydrolase activator NlpD
MTFQQRWRELAYWWKSLWPPARVFLVVVLVVIVGLAVGLPLALRPAAKPEPTAGPSLYPTSYGQVYTFPTEASTGSPAALLNDDRLRYAPGWGTEQVRKFMASRPGALGQMSIWVGDQEVPVADVITGQSLLYGVNPKVLLALIEFESGLVDNPNPSSEALDLALGYPDPATRGLDIQIRWGVRELFRGMRDDGVIKTLLLRDGRTVPVPAGASMGDYAILRVVAQTGDEATLQRFQGLGEDSFVETYRRLFGEDPRQLLEDSSRLAERPFLVKPYEGDYEITTVFDHQSPFLNPDGSVISHTGLESVGLPSDPDGHNGWDFALDSGVPVVAAAGGTVIWAGGSNDGCGSPALGVILEHGNGYQTLYWHFSQIDVTLGQQVAQGDVLGLAGATGCSIGPHLHFEVHFRGRQVDPEGWCGAGADPWAAHPAGAPSPWLWADRFSACEWPAGAVVVDEAGPNFIRSGTQWSEGHGGVGGGALWAPAEARSGVVPIGEQGQLNGVVEGGTWRPTLPRAGLYRVYAFIPYWGTGIGTADSQAARYLIHHAKGETLVGVDQALHVDRWVDLGTYTFTAGRQGFVYLDNLTDEPASFCVWFDAIVWVPEP